MIRFNLIFILVYSLNLQVLKKISNINLVYDIKFNY